MKMWSQQSQNTGWSKKLAQISHYFSNAQRIGNFLVAFEFVRRVNDAQVKNLSLPRFESCVNCYLTGDNNIQLGFKKEKKPCFSALSSSLQSQLILYKYLLFVVPLWTGNLCILTLVWEQLFSKKKKKKICHLNLQCLHLTWRALDPWHISRTFWE